MHGGKGAVQLATDVNSVGQDAFSQLQ